MIRILIVVFFSLASCNDLQSNESDSTPISTGDPGVTTKISEFSAAVSGAEILLVWDASDFTSHDSFVLFRTAESSGWVPSNDFYESGDDNVDYRVLYVGTGKNFTDATVSQGTTYRYVLAVMREGSTYVTHLSASAGLNLDAPEEENQFNLSSQLVAEHLPVGSTVGTLSSDSLQDCQYTILLDADSKFDISDNMIISTDNFDFETKTSHSVTIRCVSAGENYDRIFNLPVKNQPEFTDVNSTASIIYGYSVAWADFNGDSYPDVGLADWEGSRGTISLNQQDKTFTNVNYTEASDGQGICLGDYDGDGDVDALVARESFDDALLANDGNGDFTVSSPNVGLNTSGNSRGCAWSDYDGDGDLDVIIAQYGGPKLLRNDAGTFTDQTVAAGIDEGSYLFGTHWADFDSDGLVDLFVCGNTDALYLNDGDGTFTNVSTTAGINNSSGCKGSAVADIDNDGDIDILTPAPHVYINDGNAVFTDKHSELGINHTGIGSHSIAVFDADSDGHQDLVYVYWGSDNVFYVNDGSGHFYQPADSMGLGASGTGGTAVADYDLDGDLDLLGSQGTVLLENNLNPASNTYIFVHAVGPTSNKDQAGATLHLYDSKDKRIATRLQSPGSGLGSQSAMPVYFGGLLPGETYRVRVNFGDGTNRTQMIGSPNGQLTEVIKGS